LCCGNSAELYEEMREWELEQERMEKLAKQKKLAQTPVLTVKSSAPKN
jgi:hypothetical protein